MTEYHGYKGTRIYNTWINMRTRCNNPKAKGYERYGGRGIKVCTEWGKSFIAFLCDMGERPVDMSIERIDTNGNYCKQNCRWATSKEQLRNTRVNRILTYRGISKCLVEWSEESGIKSGTIGRRLRKGWDTEKAVFTPINAARKGVAHNQKMYQYKGEEKNLKSWAEYFKINYATLHKRITVYGMSFKEAVTRPVGKNGRKLLT